MPPDLEHRRLFTSDVLLGRVTDFVNHERATGTHVYAALEAAANIARFDLTDGQDAALQSDWDIPLRATPMRPLDLEVIGDGTAARLVISDTRSAQIETVAMSSSESLLSSTAMGISGGPATFTSQITQINVGGQSFVATSSQDTGDLQIYAQTAPTTLAHRDTVADHDKVALKDSTDLITVTIGTNSFVVSGSARDGRLSTFQVNAAGQSTLVGTVGVKQELWMSELNDLAGVTANGTEYVAIAATNSSSLSLVRVNETAVMFVTDHITDDRGSRFSNVDAIDSFEVGNRGFIVAGGSDDGVSLFEILPDGTFFAHDSIANQAGGRLESISALEAVVTGDDVQVFAGSTRGDITQLTIDISNLGAVQIGSAAGSTLTGTTSDDMIIGGGGGGADTFVFGAGGQGRVMDFEPGEDKVDISDWGQIYHLSAVQVRAPSDGAKIRYQDEVLRIQTDDRSALGADTLSDAFCSDQGRNRAWR